MRTTINIDDSLLTELKKRAGGASLTSVLNEALRRGLEADDALRENSIREFKQRTSKMGRPLVDLTKALAISADLEDQERLARMERHAT